jgi:ADP-heptose:LPS heptosyltransferase
VVVHAGGEGFDGRKQWSAERFAAVGRQHVSRYGVWLVLVGGKEDRELSAELAARIGQGAVSAAGASSLLETAALIESAELFIGNDSCPLHMAAAVNTAAVGIYGPSNVEQFQPIGPPGHRCRVVRSPLPCAPCFHFVGSEAPWVPNLCYTRECLQAISVEQVYAAACELLDERRAPSGTRPTSGKTPTRARKRG